MHYLIGKTPSLVSAHGARFMNHDLEGMAYVHLTFDDGLVAHFHVNWLAPVKIRKTIIGGSKKMVVYNDVEPTEKIKVYDKGIDVTTEESIFKTLIQYRTGDIQIPHFENREALSVEIEHFADCVKNSKFPYTDGYTGLQVVRVLEAAQESIRKEGQPVSLD
jgi:predicted dehydrogenase